MNVEIEFENYNIKSPKMPDPFNVNLINAVGSGGGGGGNEVELTWAEYEALSEAEKMNGTNYFITDINTTKSLTSKVLCDISDISRTTYTLNDDVSNYDYVVIDLLAKTDYTRIRGSMIIKNNYANSGDLVGFTRTDYYGSIEFRISGTNFIIDDFSQAGNALTSYSKIRITGYIYQRVVVPNQMINYSTVETRIGTWIDGKPLYQKTLEFQNFSISTDQTKNLITLTDITVVNINSLMIENGNQFAFPEKSTRICHRSTGVLEIFAEGNWNGTLYITLQYTKTTD